MPATHAEEARQHAFRSARGNDVKVPAAAERSCELRSALGEHTRESRLENKRIERERRRTATAEGKRRLLSL